MNFCAILIAAFIIGDCLLGVAHSLDRIAVAIEKTQQGEKEGK